MTVQFVFDAEGSVHPTEPRVQRIRALFEKMGGSMSTPRFARACIENSIYTPEELERFQIRAVQSDIRAALKVTDAQGLPFAGITTTRDGEFNAPVWKQRRLWDFADYQLNVDELLSQSDECQTKARLLSRECLLRLGRSPDIARSPN